MTHKNETNKDADHLALKPTIIMTQAAKLKREATKLATVHRLEIIIPKNRTISSMRPASWKYWCLSTGDKVGMEANTLFFDFELLMRCSDRQSNRPPKIDILRKNML